MEAITMILGIGMIYSWIHGSIVVGKKIKKTTKYENGLLIFALVSFVLYVLGTM